MKYLKLFETFKINEHNVGDMVYVSSYGPKTLGFSDGGGRVERSMPFRPKIYNFEDDTKYEIVSIDGEYATIFDEENEPIEIPTSKIYNEKIEVDYIKDCLASSFEDMIDINKCNYKQYIDELIIEIKDEPISCINFDTIFNNEFKPRLESEGFKTSRSYFIIRNEDVDPISYKMQIYIRK